MQQADFLVEIHTEELPPKALKRLATSFEAEIKTRLEKLELRFAATRFFATPRRLAVLVEQLVAEQADSVVDRKGPALEAAFDKDGKATPACVGFARSCGVTPEELQTLKTPQGSWVSFQQAVKGKNVQELLPTVVREALQALPIPKRMRWGSHTAEFVRPVCSVVMLFDGDVLDAEILGCRAGRLTEGHRFHSTGWVSIPSASHYESTLEAHHVIADFARRKDMIKTDAEETARKIGVSGARALMDDALLDEVTGLVEWPKAVCGKFDKDFLAVPQEALISAMQDHQRYFPVVDENNKLLPYFITISNIESHKKENVIAGNERVLRARLSDAAFFFTTDKKIKLIDRVEKLKNIVFQAKLGTLHDKTERVAHLASHIASLIHADVKETKRAAMLSKTDLLTNMVGEFPELQGLMGYYYALHDEEGETVATALKEQYLPRFSGDVLPSSLIGCALALADRIDTLIGVFGIHQAPTGDKDPFALRRAALGVLRILIEKKLNLDLHALLDFASRQYQNKLENKNVVQDTLTFVLDRLRPWYQDQGVSADVYLSVAALNVSHPYDIHCRIHAVQKFKELSEAESLSVANKRVSNILAKYDGSIAATQVNADLFEGDAEATLAAVVAEKAIMVDAYSKEGNYVEILQELATLRQPVDDFFDNVMVMAEDAKIRENRVLLLKKLRELFLHVADIALLQ